MHILYCICTYYTAHAHTIPYMHILYMHILYMHILYMHILYCTCTYCTSLPVEASRWSGAEPVVLRTVCTESADQQTSATALADF